jgi:hypothetical protein
MPTTTTTTEHAPGFGGLEQRQQIDMLEKQFTAVDNRVIGLSRDVTGIMTAVDKIGTQVGELTRVVTTMQSRPQTDIYKLSQLAVVMVVLIGATVGAVSYIASAINAAPLVKAELTAEFLTQRLDNGWFKPSALQIRAPGGSVSQTPQ